MLSAIAMFEYARELPIYEHLSVLTEAIWSEGTALVKALPGAGKTTCLPLALLETMPEVGARRPKIFVVQPRRVAAKLAAYRCSELLKRKVGDLVGYQVRDDVCTTERTEIVFTTAGTFLQVLGTRGGVNNAVIILDEFHERSVEMDLAIAWLKRQAADSMLRFVVMSATLDIGALQEYLGHPPAFEIPGRTFPVEIDYSARRPEESLPSALQRVCREVINGGELGAGLIFLPGKGEIESAARQLEPVLNTAGWSCDLLHGQLPLEEQRRVVASHSGKRIVLATNIAETSVTLKDVTWVVDSGEVRRLRWDLDTGFESLLLESISKASAEQRAGRAGRVQAGRCIRLFSSAQWNHLSQFEPASVLREDILTALTKGLGLGLRPEDWLTPPADASLQFAYEWIRIQKLYDDSDGPTLLGTEILNRPMSLRESLFVHYASQEHMTKPALSWVALWQEPPPRRLRLPDTSASSDCEPWLSSRPENLMPERENLECG